MPRLISFAMTKNQIKAQSKDVTRRFGWWFLKPNDRLIGVEKAMGLRKGEKVIRLCEIEILSVRPEPLNAITPDDVIREGFPDWSPAQFVEFIMKHYRCAPDEICNRIEFKYVHSARPNQWGNK